MRERESELVVTLEWVKPYIEGKRHKHYRQAVDIADHLSFHIDGYFRDSTGSNNNQHANPYFSRLISSRRPSESLYIQQYREQRYQPTTMAPCSKVINSLKKITKSVDWKVDYSKTEIPSFLSVENSLETYCEKIFPKDRNLQIFAYKMLVRWMLVDPNGIVVTMPLELLEEPGEFLRPYPFIVQSKHVYDYVEDEYCVFKSPSSCEYFTSNDEKKEGKVFVVVTKYSYFEIRQSDDSNYTMTEYPHNIGKLPVRFLGGETISPDFQTPLYRSFLHSMLSELDNAAIDSSDLDAEKVQHLYSTMWYFQTQQCTNPECRAGWILANGKQTICSTCEGRGTAPKSPYRDMIVNQNSVGDSLKNVPIPPAGYIEKNTAMVDKMMEIIDRSIYKALAAVNMEFLAQVPSNQSGIAKTLDRDELNNFVYSIAYHLINELIHPIYYFINEIRYNTVVDDEGRAKMLPTIPVPENFEFLIDKNAEDNLIKISGSNIDPKIKQLVEMNYILTKYADVPEVRERLILTQKLDPFAGFDVTELETMSVASLADKEDIILHIYLESFITTAIENDENFLKLSFELQKEVITGFAKAKVTQMEASTKIQAKANPVVQPPPVEPIIEPIVEPIVEPIIEPIVEPIVESPVEPIANRRIPRPRIASKIKK
jgi:hypothetical protein